MRKQRQQQYEGSTVPQEQQYTDSTIAAQGDGGRMATTFSAPSPSPPSGAGLDSGPNDQQLLWALERRLEGRVEELGLRVEGTEAGLQGTR